MLFLVMTDLGIVQNPMFGDPGPLAVLLPHYGPSRVMVDGAFSSAFHAAGDLALGPAWAAALVVVVQIVLRRAGRRTILSRLVFDPAGECFWGSRRPSAPDAL